MRLVAVEPSSCPTLTEGRFDYDFGDTAGMTPLLPMYTLGHEFMPPAIHAGGLRYHGDAPIISAAGARRAHGGDRLPAGQGVRGGQAVRPAPRARSPRPEAAHGIRAAIDEALAAKETGEERVILFNYCGHGLLDLAAYDDFNHGRPARRVSAAHPVSAAACAPTSPSVRTTPGTTIIVHFDAL